MLVVRVHAELLGRQKLPPELVIDRLWNERAADMWQFEDYLARNGVRVVKLFLHVSKGEQADLQRPRLTAAGTRELARARRARLRQ